MADHVYLVCEPPGEPYYIGRIMEFLHPKNDATKPVDALRINWLYRPKDIGRRAQDTRLLFATMHSDISPLAALRGKCEIRHRSEIENLDEYRRTPDCFWYEKLYDRYIQKNYDLIPTPAIINVPDRVKKVLDERWKFVLIEQGRGKDLTSAMKLCKKCGAYCARFVSFNICFVRLYLPFCPVDVRSPVRYKVLGLQSRPAIIPSPLPPYPAKLAPPLPTPLLAGSCPPCRLDPHLGRPVLVPGSAKNDD